MKAAGKTPISNRWKTKYKEPIAPDAAGLPPLPEGWCWTSIGQVFHVHVGAHSKAQHARILERFDTVGQ